MFIVITYNFGEGLEDMHKLLFGGSRCLVLLRFCLVLFHLLLLGLLLSVGNVRGSFGLRDVAMRARRFGRDVPCWG